RSGRARRAQRQRGAAQRTGAQARPPLGRGLARRRQVARVLVEEARLPRRLARPPRQGRQARGRLGRRRGGVLVPRPGRRAGAARAAAYAELARAPVPAVTPRFYAAAGPAYLAVLLAADTQVGYGGQLALGALTWIVL